MCIRCYILIYKLLLIFIYYFFTFVALVITTFVMLTDTLTVKYFIFYLVYTFISPYICSVNDKIYIKMTDLKYNIIKTKDFETLFTILESINDRQENGFRTQFNNHILNALWYEWNSFEDCKKWCLNIIDHYKK